MKSRSNQLKWFAVILIISFLIISYQNDNELDCYEKIEPKRNGDMVTIEQGIWGDIWFWEGDFMPICPSGTISPVERTI
ncbi:MAG: hypothetical protein ACFHWX_18415 [Bacteroidota bacterium]